MLCATEACARFARRTVPRLFGKALQFATERVEDLTPLFEERLNDEVLLSSDAPPVPAQGPSAEQKQILLRMHETHYRKFLDDRVPLLDDHTPREAARDPALRPKLLDLMKFHINGLERRSKADGVCYSVDWLLEELELTELK